MFPLPHPGERVLRSFLPVRGRPEVVRRSAPLRKLPQRLRAGRQVAALAGRAAPRSFFRSQEGKEVLDVPHAAREGRVGGPCGNGGLPAERGERALRRMPPEPGGRVARGAPRTGRRVPGVPRRPRGDRQGTASRIGERALPQVPRIDRFGEGRGTSTRCPGREATGILPVSVLSLLPSGPPGRRDAGRSHGRLRPMPFLPGPHGEWRDQDASGRREMHHMPHVPLPDGGGRQGIPWEGSAHRHAVRNVPRCASGAGHESGTVPGNPRDEVGRWPPRYLLGVPQDP